MRFSATLVNAGALSRRRRGQYNVQFGVYAMNLGYVQVADRFGM